MSEITCDLPKELQSWLEDFKEEQGHPLRVLHIGNIANNAYINAKILNRAGIECDVMCYDYYHIMGCPEWEDADFNGEGIDDFSPDWKSVDLNGFTRPEWFIQGPSAQCLEYLLNRRRPQNQQINRREKIYRLLLKVSGLYHKLHDSKDIGNEPGSYYQILTKLRGHQTALREWYFPLGRILYYLLASVTNPLILIAYLIISLFYIPANIRKSICQLQKIGGWNYPWGRIIYYFVYSVLNPVIVCLYFLAGLLSPVFFLFKGTLLLLRKIYNKVLFLVYDPATMDDKWDFNNQVALLIEKFSNFYPNRPDELDESDLNMYQGVLPVWRQLLKQYDIVHAYATDGIWPLLANVPYIAYEHGTIRNIPFQPSPQGRLCALTYRMANRVCITNADNIVAAAQLNLNNFSFVPHPVNEDYLVIDEKTEFLREGLHSHLNSNFIVFHPSRQHWDESRHPDWEKGNDIFIIGFARFVKEINPQAAVVLVEWGEKIEESKNLLQELGIAERVLWIRPVPNRKMIRYILATEMLADQFYLGAFGSTMPKALACGKPAMLYLDTGKHEWCFDEMPPVINVKTSDEVFAGLKKVYTDHEWTRHLAEGGKKWYEMYHSNKVIKEKLILTYKQALELN